MKRIALTIAGGAVVTALLAPGCSSSPDAQAVRALEGTDAIAFVCLGKPNTDVSIFHPVEECVAQTFESVTDFGKDGTVPHLYALVTQTTRGEVAMVDLSTTDGNVLDIDPSAPGASFFPVGANPTSIVASPKGTAAFVTSGDIARPALYALPVTGLRPCEVDSTLCNTPAPTLSSWASCTLPDVPGDMIMVADPAHDGFVRKTCSSAYEPPDETSPRGSIDEEGNGRQKLLIAMPTLGEILVLDAQTVLDGEAGSLAPCPIEKTLPLSFTPVFPPPDTPPTVTGACVNPGPSTATIAPVTGSSPSEMTYADGKIYVGDLEAPLIHVVQADSPCDAVEVEPLLPASADDPSRAVITSHVSVSPRLTPSFKRYLYAVDLEDRSVMVFDVSEGSVTRTPLLNPHPEVNPLQPSDRIRFGAVPSSIRIVQRDEPKSDPDGVAPFGTRCDPNPNLVACVGNNACDIGTAYRATTDFSSGAGPLTLRGTFAMIGLSNGQVAVIDVDDYDAACRAPTNQTPGIVGCTATASMLKSSGEGTCNVFVPNAPRSAYYIASNADVGRHLPGLQAYPIVTTKDGDVIDTTSPNAVHLRATLPASGMSSQTISVSGEPIPIDPTGLAEASDGTRDAVVMNLDDPRVHVADQEWSLTFEGALPGFTGHIGDLRLANGERRLVDETARFCHSGVQSRASIAAILRSKLDPSTTDAEIAALSLRYADRVSLTDALLDAEQGYWSTAACTFEQCRAIFGDWTDPTAQRDIVIEEAYDDHVDLGEPPQGPELTKCCFPTTASFDVRPGGQWTVIGAINGFFHHVIPDPVSGVCRDSCDPRVARLNGRVLPTPDVPVHDGSAYAFINPMFRLAITDPSNGATSVRGDVFKFTTEGGFSPLRVQLTDDQSRPNVQLRSLSFLPSIDSFVVTDGALEGILLFAGDLQGDPKQIF